MSLLPIVIQRAGGSAPAMREQTAAPGLEQRIEAVAAPESGVEASAADPDHATEILRRANAYLAQGRLQEAERSFLQAQNENRNTSNPTLLAETWNGLGVTYRKQARYPEAENCLRRALSLWTQALGGEHRKVGAALANLGLLQAFQGKFGPARHSLESALRMTVNADGETHPDVAAILSSLAFVNQQTGRLSTAESLYRRSLAIYHATAPSESPDETSVLASLGVVAFQRGDTVGSETLLRQALEQARSRAESPETGAILDHLAIVLSTRESHAEALEMFEQALAIRRKLLGPEHPDVAATMQHWAAALWRAGQRSEATRMEKTAREIHSAAMHRNRMGWTVDIQSLRQERSPL